jgi:hypothetical protein
LGRAAKRVNRHYWLGFGLAVVVMVATIGIAAAAGSLSSVDLWFWFVAPVFATLWFFVAPWFWRPTRIDTGAERSIWPKRIASLALASAAWTLVLLAVRAEEINFIYGGLGLAAGALALRLGGPYVEAERADGDEK